MGVGRTGFNREINTHCQRGQRRDGKIHRIAHQGHSGAESAVLLAVEEQRPVRAGHNLRILIPDGDVSGADFTAGAPNAFANFTRRRCPPMLVRATMRTVWSVNPRAFRICCGVGFGLAGGAGGGCTARQRRRSGPGGNPVLLARKSGTPVSVTRIRTDKLETLRFMRVLLRLERTNRRFIISLPVPRLASRLGAMNN